MAAAVLSAMLAAPAAGKDLCADPQTQTDMNQCALQEAQRADGRLNAAYKALIAQLDPLRTAKLKMAQRAWIDYRDSECAFQASEAEGGTMAPMLMSGCLATLSDQRTKQLQNAMGQ